MSLKESIKINYKNLSKSEKLVADYILKDRGDITEMTISELAGEINVSEPTIIRFTKSININGYTQLKLKASKDIGSNQINNNDNYFLHNFEVSKEDKISDIPNIIYNKTTKALNETLTMLNIENYEHIINCIAKANTIEIIAAGNSGAIAHDLMSKLIRIGIKANYNTDNHIQDLNILSLKENDIVFAISHSGSTTDIVNSVKLAKSNGQTTIVLTNFKASEITKYADYVLNTGDFETSFLSETMTSRISQLMLIDMIYSGLIISNYEKYSKQLEKVNKMVATKNI